MRREFFAIALISCSALALEVAYVRIFSVMLWYHFAFMVLSIAMLGYGASGTFLAFSKKLHEWKVALLSSLSILPCYLLTTLLIPDPNTFAWDPVQWAYISLNYLTLLLPFFCTGLVIGSMYQKKKQVSGIYLSDLTGAGAGALLSVLLLSFISPAKLIILSSLLSALSACLLSKDRRILPWILILLLSLVPDFSPPLSPYKTLSYFQTRGDFQSLSTLWDPTARTDIVRAGTRYAPGLALSYNSPVPEQEFLILDGDGIIALAEGDYLEYLPEWPAYSLNPGPALLLGTNGLDILTALRAGADVTVVDSHPHALSFLRDRYPLTGILSEPRAFLKSGESAFGTIRITLRRGIFSSSTGLYGLSENYLLTEEGIQDVMSRLSEDGYLIITRWLLYPPRESYRIASLLSGLESASERTAVFRSPTTITFLVKNSPLTPSDSSLIRSFCENMSYDLAFLPWLSENETNRFNILPEPLYFHGISRILNGSTLDYPFDISSPTDEKPFFFNFFRWDRAGDIFEGLEGRSELFFQGGFLIVLVFAQALVLSFLILILPLKISKTRCSRNTLLYFASIGLAYMLMELWLIQRLVFFLGEPVYSFSITLFALLISSGMGAYSSHRVDRALLLPVSLIYVLSLGPLLSSLVSLPLIPKFILSSLLIFPIGFLMGLPFPVQMRLLKKEEIPWAWASNGLASVLGSVSALFLSLSFGFTVLGLTAFLFYLLALTLFRKQIN